MVWLVWACREPTYLQAEGSQRQPPVGHSPTRLSQAARLPLCRRGLLDYGALPGIDKHGVVVCSHSARGFESLCLCECFPPVLLRWVPLQNGPRGFVRSSGDECVWVVFEFWQSQTTLCKCPRRGFCVDTSSFLVGKDPGLGLWVVLEEKLTRCLPRGRPILPSGSSSREPSSATHQ